AGMVTKPHAANVSLVTVFTMHMLAALPNAGEVEFSIEDEAAITREARAMFDPVLELRDGQAVMPDGPGWGIQVKQAWLESAEHRITSAGELRPAPNSGGASTFRRVTGYADLFLGDRHETSATDPGRCLRPGVRRPGGGTALHRDTE